MLKSLKKRSYRFVVVLLLLTSLLTFDVGRVIKVEAVATTAAIVTSALIGTGAIYLGYLALSGGSVNIPSGIGSDVENYLKDVGSKVAYYTSGAAIYQNIYKALRGDLISSLNNVDYTLSRQDLTRTYNDFKDVSLNQDIASYEVQLDDVPPSTPYDYAFTYLPLGTRLYRNGYVTNFSNVYPDTTYTLVRGSGARFITFSGSDAVLNPSFNENSIRNVLKENGRYYAQELLNGVWSTISSIDISVHVFANSSENIVNYLKPIGLQIYEESGLNGNRYVSVPSDSTIPLFADAPILIEASGEVVEVIPVSDTEVIKSPNYPDNNDDNNRNYPVVPYVQLPSSNSWGLNVGDLVEYLKDHAGEIIDAGLIGTLINAFKDALSGSSQDQYYSYYNEGDNYYIDYYYNTYTGDYTTYNIDISEQEDIIPVDLNTIQQYTNNQYLTLIKERAETFGETFGELVAFWHNCDPEIIYAFLGASIIVLLGAFIGKWGHS